MILAPSLHAIIFDMLLPLLLLLILDIIAIIIGDIILLADIASLLFSATFTYIDIISYFAADIIMPLLLLLILLHAFDIFYYALLHISDIAPLLLLFRCRFQLRFRFRQRLILLLPFQLTHRIMPLAILRFSLIATHFAIFIFAIADISCRHFAIFAIFSAFFADFHTAISLRRLSFSPLHSPAAMLSPHYYYCH